MHVNVYRKLKVGGAMLLAGATTVVVLQTTRARAQELPDSNLTYSRGQPVMPAYEGWHPNADGSIDLWFGYLNHNYREEPDIPIGPNNNISPAPYGPDAGQPTHFLPRNNRWVFTIRVPKDFGNKEVVWTLVSHGKTYQAYATLKPGYLHDDVGMQREFFGEPPGGKNVPPVIRIEGDAKRTAKVGQAATLTFTATDDGEKAAVPRTLGASGGFKTPSVCGDDTRPQNCGEPTQGAGGMFSVKGLRAACFSYRGPAEAIAFDPPQAKVWEDHRTGQSPWATGYQLPPIPSDHQWVIHTTFSEPGTYVVRCQAHDGFLATNENVTFTVTR